MAIEQIKFLNIPPFEIFAYNGVDGFKNCDPNKYSTLTDYCMMLPNKKFHSLGSAECLEVEYPDYYEEVYRIKSDTDFEVASRNLLNSDWIYTEYEVLPKVKKNSFRRYLFILHYRVASHNFPHYYQMLYNVAIRRDHYPHLDGWLIYNESDGSWSNIYKTGRTVDIIGWSSIPYKVDIRKLKVDYL